MSDHNTEYQKYENLYLIIDRIIATDERNSRADLEKQLKNR